MLEWLAAVAVFMVLMALLPFALRRAKADLAKRGGGGMLVGIGLAFATMFDPKIAAAMEIVERNKEQAEDEDSGDQP